MVALEEKAGVAVRIQDDGRSVVLALGPRSPGEAVTPAQALEAMAAAGVTALSEWAQALADVLTRHHAAPGQRVSVELKARPPQPGRDGYVCWKAGSDPTAQRAGAGAEGERVDFYNQSRFVFVAEGQVLGEVVEPVPATPGQDVRGGTIPPENPEPATVSLGDGAAVDEAGTLTAQADGVLHFDEGTVRVEPALKIDGDIDFNTGNINFNGDVRIGGSVRDLFQVSSKQDVEVGGTVEAAHIVTGGSLTVLGGVAAKEKGTLKVGADLTARYLNGVRGRVEGQVWVGREIDHTQLEVTGGLQAADGRIVGGRITLGADSCVGELGSPRGQPTQVLVGVRPAMERDADRVLRVLARLRRRARARKKTLQKLCPDGDMTHPRAILLAREIDTLQARRERWTRDLERRRRELSKVSKVELTVLKTLYPGVTIATSRGRATVRREQAGPVVIGQTSEGAVGIKRNGRTTFELLAGI